MPEGVFEVRVPAADAARAEELIAENPLPDEAEEVDPSSALDLETIASATSEMEAMGIKNLLDSNGIAAVLVGDSVLPNFPFEVRVAIKPNGPHPDRRRGKLGRRAAEEERVGIPAPGRREQAANRPAVGDYFSALRVQASVTERLTVSSGQHLPRALEPPGLVGDPLSNHPSQRSRLVRVQEPTVDHHIAHKPARAQQPPSHRADPSRRKMLANA